MWQAIYEELKGSGLEIVAVALDTAGAAAVEAKTKAEDIAERPDMVRRLMGWSEELWAKQAPPTYTCLIDENHVVAELYNMVNVPQGVWIDEQGVIVRPPESAGTYDAVKDMDRETFELPDETAAAGIAARNAYVEALRDWAANGADSQYALSADAVRERLAGPSDDDVLAATHVKLANYLFNKGALDAAKTQYNKAVALSPDKWSYRRNAMMLDEASIGELCAGPDFWAAVDDLGDKDYYEPAQLA